MAQTGAASSPAEVDIFNGLTPTRAEYDQWRTTNELPERFKTAAPADSASADRSEETTSENASATEAEKEAQEQDKPKPKRLTAEERVAQLRSTVEREWEKPEPDHIKIAQLETTIGRIEEGAGKKRKTEPAPVTQQQQQPQTQQARTKPTAEDRDKDGKPKYATYEEFVEDLADWKAEQQLARFRSEQAAANQQREFQARVEAAQKRFHDFDAIVNPFAATISSDPQIPAAIKQALYDSADATYLIASGPNAESFIAKAKSDPLDALLDIRELKRAVDEERAKPGETPERGEDGKFKAPEQRTTKAPKPISPVGGGSSKGAFDVNDDKQSGDDWLRGRRAQLERQGKG